MKKSEDKYVLVFRLDKDKNILSSFYSYFRDILVGTKTRKEKDTNELVDEILKDLKKIKDLVVSDKKIMFSYDDIEVIIKDYQFMFKNEKFEELFNYLGVKKKYKLTKETALKVAGGIATLGLVAVLMTSIVFPAVSANGHTGTISVQEPTTITTTVNIEDETKFVDSEENSIEIASEVETTTEVETKDEETTVEETTKEEITKEETTIANTGYEGFYNNENELELIARTLFAEGAFVSEDDARKIVSTAINNILENNRTLFQEVANKGRYNAYQSNNWGWRNYFTYDGSQGGITKDGVLKVINDEIQKTIATGSPTYPYHFFYASGDGRTNNYYETYSEFSKNFKH